MGEAYKQLIKDWREVLPAESVCLNVPIVIPDDFKEDKEANRAVEESKNNNTDTTTLLNADKK